MKTIYKLCFGLILLTVISAGFHVQAESPPPSVAPPTDPVFVPALIYHRVIPNTTSNYDFTPEQLESHFKYLKEHGYHPITATQYMGFLQNPMAVPPKPVILTFDDGNKSHYNQVFPLLKKYGFGATFFVTTDYVAEKSNTTLTWGELTEMAQSGMDIQSHTLSHPYLTATKSFSDHAAYLKGMERELRHSKDLIEQKLQSKVDLLAYPYGWFNSEVEAIAVKVGYQGLFTVNWGNNLLTQNPLQIKRRVMDNSLTLQDFRRILSARPLELEAISPLDKTVIQATPVIKFRLKNSDLKTVELIVRSFKTTLTKDNEGVFTCPSLPALTAEGYHMIIIKGTDSKNHYYLGSWGFVFHNPHVVNGD